MTLIENWQEVLTKAWSVKLDALAAIAWGIQQQFPFTLFFSAEVSSAIGGVLMAVGGLFTASAIVARLLDQGLAKSG